MSDSLAPNPMENDPKLDRLLDQMPLPKVPEGLSKKIVAEVTALPQQPPARRAAGMNERRNGASAWLQGSRAAAIGVACLIGAAALGVVASRIPDKQSAQEPGPPVAQTGPDRKLAGADPPCASQAAGPRPAADGTSCPALAPLAHPAKPRGQKEFRNKAAPEVQPEERLAQNTPAEPQATGEKEKKEKAVAPPASHTNTGLANNRPPDPAPSVVPESDSIGSIYGPPAPSGFGIAGGRANPVGPADGRAPMSMPPGGRPPLR